MVNPLSMLMSGIKGGLHAADVAAGDFALARGGSKLANLSRAFGPEAKYYDKFPHLTGNVDYRRAKNTSEDLLPIMLLSGLGAGVTGGALAGASGVSDKMDAISNRMRLLLEEQIMKDLWEQGKANGALNPTTGLTDPGLPGRGYSQHEAAALDYRGRSAPEPASRSR